MRPKHKKAISVWISWILLLALAVTLGTTFFYWMKGYTEESADDLTKRADYAVLCKDTGVSIADICQNTQTLNMNVTNSNNLKVKELMFRIFDIYNMPQTVERNITIKPQETKKVEVVKQGITKQVELIPVIYSGGNRLICEPSKTTVNDIAFC